MLWRRFKLALRSRLAALIERFQDPVKMLERNIRDMKDKVPLMNENIALIKANLTLLEKERERLQTQERTLAARIKAALKAGDEDLAADYAATLESVRASQRRTQGQLEVTREAHERASRVKQRYMAEIEQKSKEAVLAAQDAQRSEWQKQVAEAMDEHQPGGVQQTHDEMVAKIEQAAALSEARLEVALGNVGGEGSESFETETKRLRAEELLDDFRRELNNEPSRVTDDPSRDTSEPTQ